MANPCGSPGSDHRFTIFWSRVGMEARDSARADNAAEVVSSTNATARSLLECVGEVFDDRIREEPLTHLTNLLFQLGSWLLTIRKRDSKQLAGPNIFHAIEPQRAQGMLDRLSLRIEHGRLELHDHRGFHGGA